MICEYLLWVKTNEVNYLAVSSPRVQRSQRRLNIRKQNVGNARITHCSGNNRYTENNVDNGILELCDSCNLLAL